MAHTHKEHCKCANAIPLQPLPPIEDIHFQFRDQLNDWGAVFQARLEPSEGQEKQFARDPFTVAVWQALNRRNGVIEASVSDEDERDCFTGSLWPQWSHIVPFSEEHIIRLMIWLRENGFFQSNQLASEIWKLTHENVVPTIEWMGQQMKYEEGGLLFMPTLKCLWRLCLLAQIKTYSEASAKQKDYSKFKPKSLHSNWTEPIEPDMNIVKTTDGKFFEFGQGYLEKFGSDYLDSHRSVMVKTQAKSQDVKIYEYHFILTKNTIPDDPYTLVRSIEPLLSVDQVVPEDNGGKKFVVPAEEDWEGSDEEEEETNESASVENKQSLDRLPGKNRKFEEITWTPTWNTDGARVLPQKTTRITFGKGEEQDEEIPVGPTMFVPFEPITAVFMFWSTARRSMCNHEVKGKRKGEVDHMERFVLKKGTEFTKIMKLAEFYLRLVQCDHPAQLWHISEQAPSFYTEKLPTMPSHVHGKSYRSNPRDRTHKASYHGAANELALQAQMNDTSALQPLSKGLTAPPVNITEAGVLELLGDALLDADRLKMLDVLGLAISALCDIKQRRFDSWVNDVGLYEALDRQRRLVLDGDDEQISRLWSEYQLALSPQKKCCQGHCFEDLAPRAIDSNSQTSDTTMTLTSSYDD